MKRLAIFLLFIPLAMLTAGLFGALHDQISYSVSSEYYTKFKFLQFRLLDPDVPERVRASAVGFLASWWMGIPLGILCGLAGLIQRTSALMRRALILSLPIAATVTLMTALLGLAYGWVCTQHIDVAGYIGWFIPQDVSDVRRYLCVGYMHNAAYLGGALSIVAVWIFNVVFRHFTASRRVISRVANRS